MQLVTVAIDKPEATTFILGQTHFIRSVEVELRILIRSLPGILGTRIAGPRVLPWK